MKSLAPKMKPLGAVKLRYSNSNMRRFKRIFLMYKNNQANKTRHCFVHDGSNMSL